MQQRDALAAAIRRGEPVLARVAAAQGQDSRAYRRLFATWERMLRRCERAEEVLAQRRAAAGEAK